MRYSKYQLAFFSEVVNGSGNVVVAAKAGSGKSFCVVEVIKQISAELRRSTAILYFGKRQQEEMEVKIKKISSDVTVRTTYSMGLGAIRTAIKNKIGYFPQNWLQTNKYQKLCREVMEEFGYNRGERDEDGPDVFNALFDALNDAVNKCQLTLTHPDNIDEFEDMCNHFDIEWEDIEELARMATRVLAIGLSQVAMCGAYVDMIWMPVVLNYSFPKFDLLFVDEAQDMSNCQRAIIKKMMHSQTRLFAVGDPFQSIMGFAGAECDSLRRIIDEFRCKVLPLSICYRCPKSHLRYVRDVLGIPIEDAPDAIEGSIVECNSIEDLPEMLDPKRNPLIMCRINAPLIDFAFELISRGIPATVVGRELLGQLINLAKLAYDTKDRHYKVDWTTFKEKLDAYVERQTEVLSRKKGTEIRIQSMQDKSDTLQIVVGRALTDPEWRLDTIDDLNNYLEKLYKPKNGYGVVSLSSCHKAKGLEADVTVILGPEMMPHPMAKVAWQREQEKNLIYVAHTRSKDVKIICPLPGKNANLGGKRKAKDVLLDVPSQDEKPEKKPVAKKKAGRAKKSDAPVPTRAVDLKTLMALRAICD